MSDVTGFVGVTNLGAAGLACTSACVPCHQCVGSRSWRLAADLAAAAASFLLLQGQQKERQKQAMGPVDRAMYMFGQLVFGSQSARLFTFFYLAAMHLLVFSSLMRMTHHSSHALYEHQQGVLDK